VQLVAGTTETTQETTTTLCEYIGLLFCVTW